MTLGWWRRRESNPPPFQGVKRLTACGCLSEPSDKSMPYSFSSAHRYTRIDHQDYSVSWNNDVVAGGGLIVGNDVDININMEGHPAEAGPTGHEQRSLTD